MSQSIERIRNRSKALLGKNTFVAQKDIQREQTINHLHRCLVAFGNRLFNFFDKGFDGSQKYRLEPSVAYPEEYVLTSILSQVSHDVGALQKASQQRSDDALAARLKTADKLAYLALQPAMDQGILPVSTVLTYFHKSPNVRVIPYAPVALVGIPFSASSSQNNYDLLATPHEVGHYVYRHGIVPNSNGDRLRTALESRIERTFPVEERWVIHWLEEIFADVYGCLIATEAMTESFRDMLIGHSGHKFVRDTIKHPIPAVRMYVYTTALQTYKYTDLAAKFANEWDEVLGTRGRPSKFVVDEDGQEICFDEAKAVFKKTIDCIAEITQLNSLESLTRLKEAYRPWGSAGSDFDHFVDSVSKDGEIKTPELEIRGDNDDELWVNRDGKRDKVNREIGATTTWIDIINANETLEAPIPPVAWGAVFDSLDWTVEGPHSRL